MGQKVNPISNRLGVIRGWDSNWYGGKKYGDILLEDSKIRNYIKARLEKRPNGAAIVASVSKIIIERTLKMATVTICTSRPGMIIGKAARTSTPSRRSSRNSPTRRFRSTSTRSSVLNSTQRS